MKSKTKKRHGLKIVKKTTKHYIYNVVMLVGYKLPNVIMKLELRYFWTLSVKPRHLFSRISKSFCRANFRLS